jgi:hypothetical protein
MSKAARVRELIGAAALESPAMELVCAWSLVLHEPDSELHAWSMESAHAVIDGTAAPAWPGGRKSTGVSRLETITRIVLSRSCCGGRVVTNGPHKDVPVTPNHAFSSIQCLSLRHHACVPAESACQCPCHLGVANVATLAPAVGAEQLHGTPATEHAGTSIGAVAAQPAYVEPQRDLAASRDDEQAADLVPHPVPADRRRPTDSSTT